MHAAMDNAPLNVGPEELLATMDSPSRVKLLCTLFSQCSHHEQVMILERIPACFKRDYLSLLPPELVVKVLCFLGADDIFSCMLVCRHWCRVVSECDPYWTSLCKKIGVSEYMLREERPKYGSLKALALTALRYQNRIKLSQPACKEFQTDSKSVGSVDMHTLQLRPAKPISNGVFIQQEFRGGKCVLSIRGLTASGILAELASATVSHAFFIIWSSSSSKYVLVYSSTGEWVRISVSSVTESPFYLWEQYGGDIYSLPYYDIASCPECSLVAVISKAPSHNGFWDLVILKLRTGESAVEKQVCTFFFQPDKDLQGNVFFCPQKIALLPSPDTKQGDFCCSHTVLMKLGGYIVTCNLELFDSGNCAVSNPTQTLRSHSNPSLNATPSILGETFCLSCDRKLLGYVTGDTFCLWNLDTYTEMRCKLNGLKLSNKVECKAVGHLFSIICTSNTICVISSFTGNVLVAYAIRDSTQQIFAPVHQDWLNKFEPYRNMVIFEFATVFPKGQSPCVIVL